MVDFPQPRRIPLIFFRAENGNEPVLAWLKALPEEERHAIGRDLLRGAMALARWNATMPPNGRWALGGSHRPANEANGEGVALHAPGPPGSASRLFQEDADHARRGFGLGAQAEEGVGAMSEKNLGSSIDDFLKGEGIFEDAQAQAVKEVVAWQLAESMRANKISKSRMAVLLKTSRTQVDRLLDPKNDITLSSLQRAAAIVGRRVTIQLV
jgi:hypothetical protein